MRRWQKRTRLPWKTYTFLLGLALLGASWWLLRGLDIRDGRHDRGRNALVLGPTWTTTKAPAHDSLVISDLAKALLDAHVRELFLRVPPPNAEGAIDGVDATRIETLLYECLESRAWAEVAAKDLPLGDARWRRFFSLEVKRLIERNPRLRGLQLRLAVTDGDANLLLLLDDLRTTLGAKSLSVVSPGWSEAYTREIAKRVDLLVAPSAQALAWSEGKPVLVAIPASDLRGPLRRLHSALAKGPLPDNFQGVLLDADEAPTAETWRDFRERFCHP